MDIPPFEGRPDTYPGVEVPAADQPDQYPPDVPGRFNQIPSVKL
jgi:hypothetical protein